MGTFLAAKYQLMNKRSTNKKDAYTRRWLALLKLGPAAQDAVAALTDAQNDKDQKVRDYAAKALERILGGK